MSDERMNQVAKAVLVLLIEIPVLFGVGFGFSVAVVALWRLVLGNREGRGRFEGAIRSAFLLNCLMTLQWLLVIVLLSLSAIIEEADPEIAPLRGAYVKDIGLPMHVFNAFRLTWLLLLAFGAVHVVRLLLSLAWALLVRVVRGRRDEGASNQHS